MKQEWRAAGIGIGVPVESLPVGISVAAVLVAVVRKDAEGDSCKLVKLDASSPLVVEPS